MTTRKKKATKTRRPTVAARAVAVPVADLDVPAVVPVTVNRVTCDNNFPGGYRIDAVPVQPGERI